MHRLVFYLFIGALLCVHMGCAGPTGSAKAVPQESDADDAVGRVLEREDYRIGIGDVLLISVWKDESLTRQVSVLPDGTISFPLIGELRADGLTLFGLKTVIRQFLQKYVPDATLSVQVLQVNSQVVYVIGKVNRPGRFDLHSDINVLQALAMAGGLNPFAKSGRIKVFRESGEGTRIFAFDYDEVVKGERLEQNIQLKRSDVVVVP